MADVVAGIGVVEVHHVQPVSEAVGLGIRLDLRAAHAQKWADVDAPHRGDAAQPAPRAANELKEQRLGIVVGVVRRRDPCRADLRRCALQKSVAGLASRLLGGDFVPGRQRPHVGVFHVKRDAA